MNTSKKTRLKTIRIKNEVADYFEGKPLNRAVEGLYEGLMDGRVKWKDGGIEIVGRYNMKPFERACKKLSVIPDKMLNNLVAAMERNYDKLKVERAAERAEKSKEKKMAELESFWGN